MKRILHIAVVMAVVVFSLIAATRPAAALEISEDGFYEIYSAEDLDNARHYPESNFRLMNDIDLSDFLGESVEGWLPVDLKPQDDTEILIFDGGGHTVSGLWIDRPEHDAVGLFGAVRNREIRNLHVRVSDRGVTGFFNVGALAGMLEGGTRITRCGASGGHVEGQSIVGGLVGTAIGLVTESYALNSVTGMAKVAGLIGEQAGGSITYCYAMGNVAGSMIVGGLVGYQTYNEGAVLLDSYATGDVTGAGDYQQYIGGLIGYQNIPVYHCYAVGKVTSPLTIEYIGGFAGYAGRDPDDFSQLWGEIVESYYRSEPGWNADLPAIGETLDVDGLPEGKSATWLTSASGYAVGWHINGDANPSEPWLIRNGDTYPYLWWQAEPYPRPPGEPQPGVYHHVSLTVEWGITLPVYAPGELVVADGDYLHFRFLPDDREATARDVLLLVDGVDTPFRDLGGNYYFTYTLGPVRRDHSVVIALREYTVTLPEVEGARVMPSPGEHRVPYGADFRFSLLPGSPQNPGDVKVYANGVLLPPDTVGTTLPVWPEPMDYRIVRVTRPVIVTVEGLDPTGNESPDTDFLLYASAGELVIVTHRPLPVAVYRVNGTPVLSRTVNGRLPLLLSPGLYLVRAGGETRKVLIR